MQKEPRLRQEVLNTALAEILQTRGIDATPEQVLSSGISTKAMPDVMFKFRGLRVVIECEIAGTSAQRKAYESAKNRIEEGLAAVGIALVYPKELANQIDVAHVKQLMIAGETQFSIAVITEADTGTFSNGNIDYLVLVLHDAWQRLMKEDVLAEIVEEIDGAINVFADSVSHFPGLIEKMAECLGIQGAPDKKVEISDEE